MRFREYNSSAPKASTTPSPCAEYEVKSIPYNHKKSLIWYHTQTSDKRSSTKPKCGRSFNILTTTRQHVTRVCSDLFLPVGYPDTVADGYLEYQIYDSIQGLCSYLRGVVSTSAVLMAAGVGDAEATAMSAAMTWAIRDGLGMIGGLLFSYVASPHFDAHVKEFRLLADVLNDIGLTLDMALPLLMTYEFKLLASPYLVLTSISTLCKVACGISADAELNRKDLSRYGKGATKGNITDHFSIGGNRADINAKESTQETLVSLIGMALGVWLTKFLQSLEKMNNLPNATTCDSSDGGTCNERLLTIQTITWTIFLLLTFIHVWANYIGVQRLRLRTLNYERTRMALRPLVEECGRWVLENKECGGDSSSAASTSNESAIKQVVQRCIEKLPAPSNVSESLWKSIFGMLSKGNNLHLGIRLNHLIRISTASSNEWDQDQWAFLREEFHNEKYMLFVSGTCRQPCISVMIRLGSTDYDELKALLHAQLLMWCMEQDISKNSDRSLKQLVMRSHKVVKQLFSHSLEMNEKQNPLMIHSLCEKGWDTTRLYLGFSHWKCDWDFGHEHED